jgi:hypothetical protein
MVITFKLHAKDGNAISLHIYLTASLELEIRLEIILDTNI